MPKNFESKRIVKTDEGKTLIEITQKKKIRISTDKILKQIENIDKSIEKLQAKKINLQEFYAELTA